MIKKHVVMLFLVASGELAAAEIEEILVTVTRRAEPVVSAIGNSAILPREAIEMTAAVHIQEVLVRIPGVSMHRNNGQEYLPAIRSPVLSGAGACGSFLMAEDGIPLRPAGFCNVNELFEAHTEQAARIEVVRGPGNALYGSNALHGVINVIAPAAFDSGRRLALEAGPHDFSRMKVAYGEEAFALSFTGSHDGGYKDDSRVDQQKLSLRQRFQSNHFEVTTGLTAINLNQETAGYIEGYQAYKNDRLVKTNPNPEAYRDASALRLWSRFESTAEGDRSWVVTPYVRYSDMDFLQHFLPGAPLEENGQHGAGIQSAYYLDFEQSRLISGVDMEYTEGWLKQSQDAPTQGSAFLQETIPQGLHYDYEVSALQIAPFVQWDWTPNDRWKTTLGLRYESMSYDYDNLMLAGRTRDDGSVCGFGGCRYSRPEDGRDNFDNWSLKLGLSYQLNAEQQLFAGLAQGFRAPQATELYRLQRDQQVADLDSEQLKSLEIGLRGYRAKLNYELVAYLMRKDNVIFRDTDFFNVSDGETCHRGVELALKYPLAEQWTIAVATSLARHRYANDQEVAGISGNDVDSAPRHFGSAQLSWNPVEPARVELEWQHMGAYYTDPENQHRYSGHNLLNLRMQWQFSPDWMVSARVTNLLDTEYAERADFTSFSGDRYFPGEPRSLYIGIEARW